MSSKPIQLGLFSSDDDTSRVQLPSRKRTKKRKNEGQLMLWDINTMAEAMKPRRSTGLTTRLPMVLIMERHEQSIREAEEADFKSKNTPLFD